MASSVSKKGKNIFNIPILVDVLPKQAQNIVNRMLIFTQIKKLQLDCLRMFCVWGKTDMNFNL